MGFTDKFQDDEEQPQENGDGSIAYIYIKSDENRTAYDYMSNKLGGDAFVKNRLKSLPDEVCTDQHDFFQQFVVALKPALESDSYAEVLKFLMVDAENIAEYLDESPAVKEELMELLQTDVAAQEGEADDE